MGRRSRRSGSGTPGDYTLYPSRMGFNPDPPKRKSYVEVTLGARQGRVVEDRGDTLIVEMYATGDWEMVPRGDAQLAERHP